MVEMELIDLERGAGEGGGRIEVLIPGPCQKPLERPVVGVERPLRVGARGEVFEECRSAGRQAFGHGVHGDPASPASSRRRELGAGDIFAESPEFLVAIHSQ